MVGWESKAEKSGGYALYVVLVVEKSCNLECDKQLDSLTSMTAQNIPPPPLPPLSCRHIDQPGHFQLISLQLFVSAVFLLFHRLRASIPPSCRARSAPATCWSSTRGAESQTQA